jgi:hypothetical protein
MNKSKAKPKITQILPKPVYNLKKEEEEEAKPSTFTRYEKELPVEKPHIAN